MSQDTSNVTKRKLRFVEAFCRSSALTEYDYLFVSQASEELAQLKKAKQLISNHDEEGFESRLKTLENWEVTKRKAIEALAYEIEDLQERQDTIEKREKEVELAKKELYSRPAIDLNMITPKSSRGPSGPQALAHSTPLKGKATAMRRRMPLMVAANMKDNTDAVVIGPNGTTVSKLALNAINWSLSGPAITRKILMEVFDRQTLAFHTLTGKPSPAFIDCDKPLKNQLNPQKVADIIHIMTENLNMSAKEVRCAITTKCADENKMFRQRARRRQLLAERKPASVRSQ